MFFKIKTWYTFFILKKIGNDALVSCPWRRVRCQGSKEEGGGERWRGVLNSTRRPSSRLPSAVSLSNEAHSDASARHNNNKEKTHATSSHVISSWKTCKCFDCIPVSGHQRTTWWLQPLATRTIDWWLVRYWRNGRLGFGRDLWVTTTRRDPMTGVGWYRQRVASVLRKIADAKTELAETVRVRTE